MVEEITFEFEETEEEMLSEKKERKGELLVVDEGEDLDWDLDEEIGEYGNKPVNIDRVTLKAVARRSNSVKILRFLLKHSERGFSCKEVYKIKRMPYTTVNQILRKLVKAEILERVVPYAVDKRNKCYRIANLKVVESIIRLHDRFASFKLARLLPLSISSYVSLNELKEKPEFLEICAKFKLELDEGIECLKLNTRKVELVYSGTYGHGDKLVGFRRKEQ